ncbi:hypothetical protein CEXT_141121 [Caerostris extrusa]|uniref:Uncharacterized protein n=1 Tax=Caerostris extrusa TaxID=172846 RepID=A0AAV4QGU6_CAEEX|nr:hypothetical protein CEXT_141121 [Caerostris extrusa]
MQEILQSEDSLSGRGHPDIHNCLPFKTCFYETKTFVRETYKHIFRDNSEIFPEGSVPGIINRLSLSRPRNPAFKTPATSITKFAAALML